jgi:hypothetical protein
MIKDRLEVGDLVTHVRSGVVGVVTEVRWHFDDTLMLMSPLSPDEIVYTVQWNDEVASSGAHWAKELEVLDARTK